jgi:hypothetical protein
MAVDITKENPLPDEFEGTDDEISILKLTNKDVEKLEAGTEKFIFASDD